MNKFYLKDCPDNKSMHMFISESIDMSYYVENMKPNNPGLLFEFEDTMLDLSKLNDSIDDAFDVYGWHGFLNIFGTKFSRNNNYGGLSLVYNPEYRYKNIPTVAQTLGYPRNNIPDELFIDNFDIFHRIMEHRLDKDIFSVSQESGTHAAFQFLADKNIITQELCNEFKEQFENRTDIGERLNLNCYSDTWGFNKLTEPATHGYLKTIVDRIKRSPVRSRIAQIKGIDDRATHDLASTYLWHRDDSWFYELRINLSLDNPENAYGIEIEDYGQKPFTPGNWYVWDTYTLHRPYIEKPMPGHTRTNYVLAVNPWFDFIEEEQCWVKNEFFGEKHPVDMVIDGDVLDGLKRV